MVEWATPKVAMELLAVMSDTIDIAHTTLPSPLLLCRSPATTRTFSPFLSSLLPLDAHHAVPLVHTPFPGVEQPHDYTKECTRQWLRAQHVVPNMEPIHLELSVPFLASLSVQKPTLASAPDPY
jgi:hypothetical protein